jgi:hypothetical protein
MTELIDRQAALKKMCETCGYCEKFEKSIRSTHPDFVADKCNNYKFLAEQPIVEAEPVHHGRWIEGTSRGSYSIYCSYCGSHKETICPDDYCPSCGALMDLHAPTEAQLDEADSVMMGGADNG